jgi:hypothetical protein
MWEGDLLKGPVIFISYRRGANDGYAGRLYDELAKRFGHKKVFRDIDSITAGERFTNAIEQSLSSCKAFIVVIGERWLTIEDESGGRRLDNPQDVHRMEIATALKLNIKIIPVLVQRAAMPRPQDLPEILQPLAECQAIELGESSWPYDLGQLVKGLKQLLGWQIFSWQRFGIILICILALVSGIWLISKTSPTNNADNENHSGDKRTQNSNTPLTIPDIKDHPSNNNNRIANVRIEALTVVFNTSSNSKNPGDIIHVKILNRKTHEVLAEGASSDVEWPDNSTREIEMRLNSDLLLTQCNQLLLRLELTRNGHSWEGAVQVQAKVGATKMNLGINRPMFKLVGRSSQHIDETDLECTQ